MNEEWVQLPCRSLDAVATSTSRTSLSRTGASRGPEHRSTGVRFARCSRARAR